MFSPSAVGTHQSPVPLTEILLVLAGLTLLAVVCYALWPVAFSLMLLIELTSRRWSSFEWTMTAVLVPFWTFGLFASVKYTHGDGDYASWFWNTWAIVGVVLAVVVLVLLFAECRRHCRDEKAC